VKIPHLVHRIDKNTSGILLVAKNELAQSKLAKQIEHTLGIRVAVTLLEPASLARSEGKAKRVTDSREL
jgi:phenylacetate-CoA ligase